MNINVLINQYSVVYGLFDSSGKPIIYYTELSITELPTHIEHTHSLPTLRM